MVTARSAARSIAASVLALVAALPALPAAASTPVFTYRLIVNTGTVANAGTDANVFVTLIGTNGSSPEVRLDTRDNDDFQSGQIDYFDVKSAPLGTLTGLRVRHDNTGSGPGWFLQQIQVNDECTGQMNIFVAQRWLALTEDDHRIDLTLTPAGQAGQQGAIYHYRLTTLTGVQPNADTDARVFATIQGTNGSAGERRLNDPYTDDFERGRLDSFDIRASRINSITSVRIRHDNSGSEPGWYLERVYVTDECRGDDYTFRTSTWLALSEAPNRIDMTFTNP